jgi:uncharacterized membrane protein YeaQ/YmgE (transglycosylase-associated protein family)
MFLPKEGFMIWSLLVGLVVGAIAKFLMPGKDPGGIFITMLIGVAGAAFASWLGSQMGYYEQGQPVGMVAAVIGSMLLLGIYRLVFKKK